MNERIKELAKQAGDYVNEVYTGPVRSKTPGKIWEDGHVGWHTQFNEKFAELIVRECVEELRYTVLDTQELRRDKSTDYQVGWEDGMFDAEETIKLHFGVEE